MPIFTRPPFPQKHIPSWMNLYMVCKERAEALVKFIRWAFQQLLRIFLSLFASHPGNCSVLCDHWRKTKGLVYSHETNHCLSQTATSQKKKERLLIIYVCRVCRGSKNNKNVLSRSIMISLEQSVSTWQFPVNKVINFGPCWEAPYLWLVTYWQLTLSD